MSEIPRVIDSETTIVWMRRDLRLRDQAALYHALKENRAVLPVFIFDTQILGRLNNKQDRRVEFIRQSLLSLQRELEEHGSSIAVLHGDPVSLFASLNAKAVYTNEDYEPYARNRDGQVKKILEDRGIPFHTYKDQVIFARNEVVKDDGHPYTIFTPYSHKWKALFNAFRATGYPTEKYFKHLRSTQPLPVPSLEELGFESPETTAFPPRVVKRTVIEKYDQQRNFPAVSGTSRLSVHLRFGSVSIRQLAKLAIEKNEVWLNELIWRDFYHMILWHFPHVEKKAFKPRYEQIEWRNDPVEYKAWCEGRTGYPIVDAGMRELNRTGFMHNRARMIVASFLTKHLLIDWRWGEAYFAEKLLDFDLAANNGGWQWAAGSGCDAAPYFRVFNPALQTKKFDPGLVYVRTWVPELGTDRYPKPIVEHIAARRRALRAYGEALGRGEM